MVSFNGVINNSIGASISGVTNTLTITNPSNTASSAAREIITVGGAAAGDPTINWNVSGVTDFEMGIDNSVSDNLTISQSAALGTNDVWRMTTSGQRTMPLQPAFKATLSATVNNVTGDGTAYTIIYDIVNFDQGSNYNNATGIFTAPVTGKYLFGANNTLLNLSAANSANCVYDLVSSSIIARLNLGNLGNMRDTGSGAYSPIFSHFFDMNSGDTLKIVVTIPGGTKTVGLLGGPREASFWGFLVL